MISIKQWSLQLLLALVLGASLSPVQAEPAAVAGVARAEAEAGNSIRSLDVMHSDGGTIVKLSLKQAPPSPLASFSIASPARVAFDFPGTGNGLGSNVRQINQGALRSINVVQVGDRTRLVLNLNKLTSYETRVEGPVVYITLAAEGPVVGSAQGGSAVSRFAAEQPQQGEHVLREINFRRGKDGEGRVIFELSDANVGIDLQRQGKNLLINFGKTALPETLARRLDVTDFATPVTSVNVQTQAGNTQVSIAPHGLWDYNAYQSDNQFVVEVRAVSENKNQLIQGGEPGAHGEKLSLNFQNIEVRAVLQVIADFTNYNIITSDTVSGNVTLRLKDVPWDQALDIILQSKGLGMRKNGNVIWIAPDKELTERDEYQSRSRQALTVAEPMRTETFNLSYAKAEDVVKLLTGGNTKSVTTGTSGSGSQPAGAAEPAQSQASVGMALERGAYLSVSGAVTMDPRTNQLFVTDYPQFLDRVKKLITQIDKPVKQVLIEARIVSAEDNFGRSLGVRLGYNDNSANSSGGLGSKVPGTNSTFASLGGSMEGVYAQTGRKYDKDTPLGTPATLAQSNFVNLPATSLGGAAPSTFAVSLFKNGLASFINLELQAAETDGRVKGIASPRVVTANARQAEIAQGVEIPYTVYTNNGPVTLFKKAVLKLNVTPQITSDGTVILDLDVSNDEVGAIYADGVSINTKNIKTKVTVENGGTVVLGGVYQQAEQEKTNKVPLLGDLPVIGNLFKTNTRTQARKELLVFITPKIIDEQIQAAVK